MLLLTCFDLSAQREMSWKQGEAAHRLCRALSQEAFARSQIFSSYTFVMNHILEIINRDFSIVYLLEKLQKFP